MIELTVTKTEAGGTVEYTYTFSKKNAQRLLERVLIREEMSDNEKHNLFDKFAYEVTKRRSKRAPAETQKQKLSYGVLKHE